MPAHIHNSEGICHSHLAWRRRAAEGKLTGDRGLARALRSGAGCAHASRGCTSSTRPHVRLFGGP
eukprot:6611433-Pyramimonas_sp.AAC.1